MCDERTAMEAEAFLKAQGKKRGKVTRRKFNSMSAGAGLAMMLPPVVNAQQVVSSNVEITTPDGIADCFFVHPASGSHAAVLVWPDILGLRPAFEMMGERLAESGYSVLVVNPFYRGARAPVVEPGASFQDEAVRNTVFPLAGQLNAETHFQDAEAFVTWLDAQDAVDTSRGIGTTGYCMGGPMVMRTVAAAPHRVNAGATFHGGGLATAESNSPHLLIPEMQASMLHAIAANDDEQDPQAKTTLREAYATAGINAEVEVYTGTQHGWCPPDSDVYDEEQAEHAWSRLLVLFDEALA